MRFHGVVLLHGVVLHHRLVLHLCSFLHHGLVLHLCSFLDHGIVLHHLVVSHRSGGSGKCWRRRSNGDDGDSGCNSNNFHGCLPFKGTRGVEP